MGCCDNDFLYPMSADIYYPKITQGDFGEIKKEWIFDRTIACNAMPFSRKGKEEILPEMILQYGKVLIARVREDIRFTSHDASEAITNILISNIRFPSGELIYKETAGPRAPKGTIFEVGSFEPTMGPFSTIDYYKMLWRRTESQAIGD